MIEIRDALPDELDAAGAVVRAAYQEFEPDYPPEYWARFIQAVGELAPRAEHGQIILALRFGEIIGTITFYADGSKSGQGDWPEGWAGAVRLGVLPSARGLGVARALMDECLIRAREAGARAFGLHTTDWMHVAQGMYERMGFVRAPEFDFYPSSGVIGLGYRYDLTADVA